MPMKSIRPLPSHLVKRYHGWKATTYTENQVWYRRLAEAGQRPRAMIVACCDSRVNMTLLETAWSDTLRFAASVKAGSTRRLSSKRSARMRRR